MNKRCNPYSLLLVVFAVLFFSGCEHKSDEKFTVKRNYHYTIRAAIGGSKFELKPKLLRRWKFRHLPEKPDAAMYAYRLTSQYKYNDKLNRWDRTSADTVEIAVTKFQADSLFTLAKAVFESVSVSNIDTIYSDPRITYGQTDDASGIMRFESKYGDIEIQTGPLHSSENRQGVPFLALWRGFEVLFSAKKE